MILKYNTLFQFCCFFIHRGVFVKFDGFEYSEHPTTCDSITYLNGKYFNFHNNLAHSFFFFNLSFFCISKCEHHTGFNFKHFLHMDYGLDISSTIMHSY